MNKIITFGCRLNSSESEKIDELTCAIGLVDHIIINSCAVTAEAERKLRQMIRKIYNEDNNSKIILTGCAAELNSDFYLGMPGVVGIIPNHLKLERPAYEKFVTTPHVRPFKKATSKIRGFLQIQNGCDNFCTYCVVRFTRGRNISFEKERIVFEAKELLGRGYKEIVLTGVNISAYNLNGEGLASLIRYILKEIPELKRLRLSSLDPFDIDDELVKIIANEERLMPHIHESIQSGDDIILKRMLRRHTRSQIIDINQKILALRKDVVFGADIIVGFPTEDDEMFLNSKKLLKEASLSLLHIFPFSARKLTSAAKMPQVPERVRKARAAVLKEEANKLLYEKLTSYTGRDVEFIAESEHNARTNNFLVVKSNSLLASGEIYHAKCVGVKNKKLIIA